MDSADQASKIDDADLPAEMRAIGGGESNSWLLAALEDEREMNRAYAERNQ